MLELICLLILSISAFYIWNIISCKHGAVRWIYLEIIYNCFIKFIMGFMKLSSVLNYITDLILLIIVLYYFFNKKVNNKSRIPYPLKIVFCIYLIAVIISYLMNLYSPLLFVWGMRNNMRFIVFAMMCSAYLTCEDINDIFDILFGYFILNIITVTYEFFFAGFSFHTGDLISGLYSEGTIGGGNGALNIFICIMCTISIVKYLNKEKKLAYMLVCIIGSLYMAALSELKIFFVEIVIISILAVWLCKKSIKLIAFFFAGMVGLIFAINIFYQYFPQFENFFAFENLKDSIFSTAQYGGNQSISRTGAIRYVMDNFLRTIPEKMFGIGFGNADYSSFSILTSDFYLEYSSTAYQWFYAPFIMIETGIMGLSAYILILLNFVKESLVKNISANKTSLKNISFIISILAIIMLFYNQSLKLESSVYLIYFCLSIPYIMNRIGNKKNKNQRHIIIKFNHFKKRIL